MDDVACAVTHDLNRHEYEVAKWQKACERFDDDVFDIVSEEIEAASEALTALADAIVYHREELGLAGYTENEYEERVQEALMKVEG